MEWGWHWDAELRVWIEDNGSEEEDVCILWARDLPDVQVELVETPDDLPSEKEIRRYLESFNELERKDGTQQQD